MASVLRALSDSYISEAGLWLEGCCCIHSRTSADTKTWWEELLSFLKAQRSSYCSWMSVTFIRSVSGLFTTLYYTDHANKAKPKKSHHAKSCLYFTHRIKHKLYHSLLTCILQVLLWRRPKNHILYIILYCHCSQVTTCENIWILV